MNETDNNKIRESIEQIEPAAGAKERMLANIRRKAAEQSSENAAATQTAAAIHTVDFSDTAKAPDKASTNRRITAVLRWAVPAAACLIIVILGAVQFFPRKNKPSDSGNNTVTATITQGGDTSTYGPLTTYSTSEELATATGIRIDAPAGAADVSYESAGTDFAQVCFTYSGREYTLRASSSDSDFSGLYGEESKPRNLIEANGAVYTLVQDEIADSFKLVWKSGALTNILIGPGDTPDETIVEIYWKLAAK